MHAIARYNVACVLQDNDKNMTDIKTMMAGLSYTECHALKALEKKAHKWAEDACNYPISERTQKRRENIIYRDIARIFGTVPTGFFYNGDPRGYALKIDNEKASVDGIARDWGGYGILAHPGNFTA